MQQSRRFPRLFTIALLAGLVLPPAHAIDLSLTATAGGGANDDELSSAGGFTGPHLGPAEFDAEYDDLAIEDVDLWERIRRGFTIPDLNNPLVATHVTWYSSRPDYIQRTTQRASRYLYHVVQELEKRDMPMELALLPFIESAFNPNAYSTAKAAGMWQFIPSTGRDFNLKQNMFRDERRDVVASTHAALSYLQKLYGMFGDWQLALAAYNWGEGSVSRAIAKANAAGRATDFNSLSAYMPNETRNYYPKLQAVKNIIAAPAQYGIWLPKVDNEPYFVSVNKTRDIDIKLAAQLAEMPLEEFKALNPQFNRPVITGSPNTQILLPQTNAEKFRENLSKWTHSLSSWTAHKVTAARERIEVIAARFKTTPQVIREVNAIPPNMHPKAGSVVLVPKTAVDTDGDIGQELADNAMLAVEPDEVRKKIVVKVGKSDTMASITRRYKVSADDVREWNDLKSDKLKLGQQLTLQVKVTKKSKGSHPAKSHRQTADKSKSAHKGADKGTHKSTNKSTSKSANKHASGSGTAEKRNTRSKAEPAQRREHRKVAQRDSQRN